MLRKQSELLESMTQNSKRDKDENEDRGNQVSERKIFSLMAF